LQSDVDTVLDRVSSIAGVKALLIFTYNGIPIKSNINHASTMLWSALIPRLVAESREFVKRKDGELTLLRIRSSRNEILIAPDKDYIMLVIHEQVLDKVAPEVVVEEVL